MTDDGAGDRAGDGGEGRGRVAVAAAIAGGVGLSALVAAWIERAPIVAHFVDRALAERGVRASYRIAAVGPFVQRLEDVKIGDPASPDLRARAIEVTLAYGRDGPRLAAVRADGARLAVRVSDGRVSLGAIDRLLPPPSGRPFALPAIRLRLSDARLVIDSAAGRVVAAVDGSGRLTDGFRGTVRAQAPALALGGCVARTVAASWRLAVAEGRPRVVGPVTLDAVRCSDAVRAGAGRATVDLRFGPALDRWAGTLDVAGFAGAVPGLAFGALAGRSSVAGDARRMEGRAALTADGVRARAGTAARLAVAGPWRVARPDTGLVFAGSVALRDARLAAPLVARVAAAARPLAGTPIAPVAARTAQAAAALLRRADLESTVALTAGGRAGTRARVRHLILDAASGARVAVDEGEGFGWDVRGGGWRSDGTVRVRGGGLPDIDLRVRQAAAGAPVTGVARIAPIAAAGARLALTPVRVSRDAGATRVKTVATLDGPVAGGRIEALSLPIDARIGVRGGWSVDPGCVPVGFARLRLAGATFEGGRLRACGVDGTAIASAAGIGVALPAPELHGRSGTSPLTLSAARATVRGRALAVERLSALLGDPRGAEGSVTRLEIGTLDGALGTVSGGAFADAAGQIAHVPLLLSGAAGRWTLSEGVLRVEGGMTVSDADAEARFHPMRAEQVVLTLAGGRIDAVGHLHEPHTGRDVMQVTLRHDLRDGRGDAALAVPGLVFDAALQPELLTPVTLGVVANVAGRVEGEGAIRWSGAGVTSEGAFRTERIDLAAAFGPVKGIAGTIRFSDLLGLVTPPGQIARVAEINPGVAVTDGVVRYQLLPGQRVAVESGAWPFAGGRLTLAPTILAFGDQDVRRLTFRIQGLDAARFVQNLALPNVAATGTFDGLLPMRFDTRGGTIDGGSIVARPPGGTLAYVGELSNAQLGAMGKLAFDALKAIRYRSLSIALDGRLDGEIVSLVRFEGVRQATGDGGIAARLIRNLPFRFNIALRAPFRSLLGTARSYADPSLLLAQPGATAATVAPMPPTIQPTESDPVR